MRESQEFDSSYKKWHNGWIVLEPKLNDTSSESSGKGDGKEAKGEAKGDSRDDGKTGRRGGTAWLGCLGEGSEPRVQSCLGMLSSHVF